MMGGFILISLIGYFTKSSVNPVTGEKQRVDLTPEQEIAMGQQSAPEMAAQFGGLYPDDNLQLKIKAIGRQIVQNSDAARSPYQFNFHVLADEQTVNAFALPGGPIFITKALLNELKSDDEIASVLGHEIGHVVNRHSAEQLAQQGLLNGIIQGIAMGSQDMTGAQVASIVGQMVNMKYGREDELESDAYGVRYADEAGYDPEAAIAVMEVLAKASGGRRQNEFMSTHPSPENRITKLKEEIAKLE